MTELQSAAYGLATRGLSLAATLFHATRECGTLGEGQLQEVIDGWLEGHSDLIRWASDQEAGAEVPF